jgi:hypothetical protein
VPEVEIKFNPPNYDEAYSRMISSIADDFARRDDVLGMFPSRAVAHGGPHRNVRSPAVLDQPLMPIRYKILMSFQDIRNGNVDAHTNAIVEAIEQYLEGIGKLFFQTIHGVSEATGNLISADGEPLSFDHICDLIEKMDISFDEFGRLVQPTILVNPQTAEKLRAIEPTPEQEQRLQDIYKHKREKFNAQKRARRLS